MRIPTLFLSLLILGTGTMTAQNLPGQAEPEIDKNSISIHPVRRGNMPIRLTPTGEIVSLTPPEALFLVPSSAAPSPQIGQMTAILLNPSDRLMGSIVDIDRATLLDSWKLTVRAREPFPAGLSVGTKVGSLIEVGELKDVLYFERPANARANSEMPLFVMEPNGDYAKRVSVRFGRQSGALLQIADGLSGGDKVIVTDTTQWNSYGRLRIK